MLQAWPAHDSLSQQSAQAQSPAQPREEHTFPKASTSDQKIPHKTESEDKVEACTGWVSGKDLYTGNSTFH